MASREIEARLKISAVDRASAVLRRIGSTAAAVGNRVAAQSKVAAKAAQIQARVTSVGAGITPMQIATTAAAAGLRQAIVDHAALERQINRIGITAGATDQQVGSASAQLMSLAQDTAVPLENVVAGFDSLVASGRSWEDAMSFLPAVIRTSQAAGAATEDIAQTADALSGSMKIAGEDMQLAFDKLVTGGKAGKFELKDMAAYLPSILPMMSALGYSGIDGLEKTVALMQTMRLNTGTASEAATNLTNVLGKIYSNETIGKFRKEFGINLPKSLKKATDGGEDLLEAFVRITKEATGGDMEKVKRIFTDQQLSAGMLSLMQRGSEYQDFLSGLKNASGAVEGDLARVLSDTQTKLDRFNNSWIELKTNIASTIVDVGLLDDLNGLANEIKSIGDYIKDVNEKGFLEATQKGIEDYFRYAESIDTFGSNYRETYKQMSGGAEPSSEQIAAAREQAGASNLSESEAAAVAQNEARRGGLAAAYKTYADSRLTSARQAEAMQKGSFAVTSREAPFDPVASGWIIEGASVPRQADSFRPARLMRPPEGPGTNVSAEEIGRFFEAMTGVPAPRNDDLGLGRPAAGAPSVAPLPVPRHGDGTPGQSPIALPVANLEDVPASLKRITTAAAEVDIAGPVGSSVDQAAAAVEQAADRIIAARARVDAAWSRPLPTPAAPSNVRVDVGRPMFDENSIMP